jgi:prepilin-type N-terminal cleavage/methylation domain-containing protein
MNNANAINSPAVKRLPVRSNPLRYGCRLGMTLVELMVAMVIISILSSLSLAGLAVARTSAKRAKTISTIRKLSEIILPYYEEYETRRPALRPADEAAIAALSNGRALLNQLKQTALCRLMTLELPERVMDLNIDLQGAYSIDWTGSFGGRNVTLSELPPVVRRYRNLIAGSNGSSDLVRIGKYDSGELLHLIVTRGPCADPDIVSHFRADEVGDPDNDGLLEFVDGWNKPIAFRRWPVGFQSPLQPIDGTLNSIDTLVSDKGHRLAPLIFSAGQDGVFDIVNEPGSQPLSYSAISYDPFAINPRISNRRSAWDGAPVAGHSGERRPGTHCAFIRSVDRTARILRRPACWQFWNICNSVSDGRLRA